MATAIIAPLPALIRASDVKQGRESALAGETMVIPSVMPLGDWRAISMGEYWDGRYFLAIEFLCVAIDLSARFVLGNAWQG